MVRIPGAHTVGWKPLRSLIDCGISFTVDKNGAYMAPGHDYRLVKSYFKLPEPEDLLAAGRRCSYLLGIYAVKTFPSHKRRKSILIALTTAVINE